MRWCAPAPDTLSSQVKATTLEKQVDAEPIIVLLCLVNNVIALCATFRSQACRLLHQLEAVSHTLARCSALLWDAAAEGTEHAEKAGDSEPEADDAPAEAPPAEANA